MITETRLHLLTPDIATDLAGCTSFRWDQNKASYKQNGESYAFTSTITGAPTPKSLTLTDLEYLGENILEKVSI